jgi:hypothetical protein
MAKGEDQVYRYNGRWYLPCNSARLAAGPFLPASPNWVEQHVELPSEFLLDRYPDGVRMDRAGLAAAWVHGDSMIYRGVHDGNLAIFQRYDFDYLYNDSVVVIEKVGDEEGFGAWELKKLVIKPPRSSPQSECEEPIHWNDPEIVLYSYNPRVSPYRLDPFGQYRVHGIFRRALPIQDVTLVDSDVIRGLARGRQ